MIHSYIFQLACVLFFILLTTSGTLGCDPDTGPAGWTHCFLQTPHYSKHQYVTCLSDAYIRQKSKGQHQCRNRTSTYCYYQCMIEKYDLDQGPVYDDCLCEASQPLPQPSVILPADCYHPNGTDCGWYRRCLAKMFPCEGHYDYAISFGERICNRYTNSTLHFSRKAVQWINATRKCLQLALVPALHFGPVKPTCKQVRKMAFDSHFPCYVAPRPGLSFCNLSLADWERVFWTVKSGFLPPTFAQTFKEAIEVVAYCGIIWSTHIAKHMYSITVQLDEKTRGNVRSDDELAHAVILHISSSPHWSEDSTIDWYAFAAKTSAFHDSSASAPSTDHALSELTIQVINLIVSMTIQTFVYVTICR